MPDFIRELSGLKIFTSQKHVGVSQPGTLETNANSHANQMRRFNCQKCVVRGIGGWHSGGCCKRIDLIAGFILVNGDKSLNEVILRQTLSARIDSDENICDVFFVCRVTDFQSRQRIIRQIQKRIDVIFDSIFFLVCQQGEFFLTAAFVGFLDKMSPQRTDGIVLFCQEHITDATDPLGVLFVCLGPHGKFASQRIIGDFYFTICEILVLHLDRKHSRNKGSQTLLTVNDEFLRFFIGF